MRSARRGAFGEAPERALLIEKCYVPVDVVTATRGRRRHGFGQILSSIVPSLYSKDLGAPFKGVRVILKNLVR